MLPRINHLVLTCFLLAIPGHSFAQQYALLVGVSSYSAPDIRKLRGPKNDVVIGKEVLKGAGFSEKNIRVLADGVAISNGDPTRQGILDELDALAKKVQRGDFVYLQFGGHGSQQLSRPGKMPKEPDGLDEIFLPVDAGSWDEVAGIKHNVIRDDEMGVAINAIRAKGAFVWAVFDACHSGNITRGGEDGVTERRLEIPESILLRARKDVAQTKGGEAPATRGGDVPAELALGSTAENLEGGYVYFYAAQTTEPTQERPMPERNPNRKAYGVFTYTLAQVVQNNPGITYRQAGERVLQIYGANRWGATPMFEGSGIDAPVFMQKAGDVLWQWPVTSTSDGFEIKAGSLQQFETGAIFAIFPDAAAKKDAAPLGYFKADKVDVLGSHLVPIKYNDKPSLDNIPTDAVVRLVDSNINLNLRVALPPTVPKGKEYELAKQAIDKLRKEGREGLKVEWVNANQPAQVRLMLSDDRVDELKGQPKGNPQIWFLPSDRIWVKEGSAKTPSILLNKTESKLSSVLIEYLQSIAKATNLYRLSTMGGKGVAGGDKVETHFFVTKAQTGKRVEILGGSVPEIEMGDALEISITSNNLKPVDVTVLGIDANYGIGLLFPLTSKEVNRVHPNETITIPSAGQRPLKLDGKTQGRESVLVIAVEAEPNSPIVNLGFLKQSTLGTRGGVTRGNVSIRSLFENAGFGNDETAATRGFNQDADAERTSIKIIEYKAKVADK